MKHGTNYIPNMVSQRIVGTVAIAVFFLLLIFFVVTTGFAFSPLFGGNTGLADTLSQTGSHMGISSGSGDTTGGSGETTASRMKISTILTTRLWNVLFFTIKEAFFSMVIAVLIGVPAAFFVACRKFPGRRFLESLSAVSLCIPPLLIALGFVLTFGMNGAINKLLMTITGSKNAPITFLYSFTGLIIAHGFYNFPIVMRTVADTWANLSQDEYDTANLLGANKFRIFRTVTIFQLAPSIASSAIIVFLYCFFSFIIVLLFGSIGGTTMEVEIYQAAKNTLDFRYAALLALTETVAAIIIIFFYVYLGKKGMRTITGKNVINVKKISGAIEITFAIIMALLIGICFLLPLGLIIVRGFTEFGTLFARKGFSTALWNTVYTSISTGLLSVTCGFVFAVWSRRIDPNKKSFALQVFPLIPMAVSSVVLGFGMTLASNALSITGSPFLLILTQSSLVWPFALQQINRTMEKIPLGITETATLLSSSKWDVILRVLLPQSARGILSAFGFCVAISVGDASLPLILSIPRFETLSLFTYRLAGSYKFNEACAAGTILMIIGVALFVSADLITEKKRGKK